MCPVRKKVLLVSAGLRLTACALGAGAGAVRCGADCAALRWARLPRLVAVAAGVPAGREPGRGGGELGVAHASGRAGARLLDSAGARLLAHVALSRGGFFFLTWVRRARVRVELTIESGKPLPRGLFCFRSPRGLVRSPRGLFSPLSAGVLAPPMGSSVDRGLAGRAAGGHVSSRSHAVITREKNIRRPFASARARSHSPAPGSPSTSPLSGRRAARRRPAAAARRGRRQTRRARAASSTPILRGGRGAVVCARPRSAPACRRAAPRETSPPAPVGRTAPHAARAHGPCAPCPTWRRGPLDAGFDGARRASTRRERPRRQRPAESNHAKATGCVRQRLSARWNRLMAAAAADGRAAARAAGSKPRNPPAHLVLATRSMIFGRSRALSHAPATHPTRFESSRSSQILAVAHNARGVARGGFPRGRARFTQ